MFCENEKLWSILNYKPLITSNQIARFDGQKKQIFDKNDFIVIMKKKFCKYFVSKYPFCKLLKVESI